LNRNNKTYKVQIGQKILSENAQYARKNARVLEARKILCLNMISSPGSGKTTILTRTIGELKNLLRIGVIEGDVQTDIDAERIRATGVPALQINTRGACHLSASQIHNALNRLRLDSIDIIFIENVGNLVCPSVFELGENAKIAVLSVPEGDDKPVKYPAIFARAKALIINKIDLLGPATNLDFDIERVKADTFKLNKDIAIFPLSAKTGEGMAEWHNYLQESVKTLRKT